MVYGEVKRMAFMPAYLTYMQGAFPFKKLLRKKKYPCASCTSRLQRDFGYINKVSRDQLGISYFKY